jgi:hypothetical protein
VVGRVIGLEFEYMVGVGIVDLPDYEFQFYSRDQLAGSPQVVDTEVVARDAERLLTFATTTGSVLIVRCSCTPRSRESLRGRHLPWAQGWIGEIALAGCCTSITGRQHDGTEFVHPCAPRLLGRRCERRW